MLTAIKGIGPWTAEVYLLLPLVIRMYFQQAMSPCKLRSVTLLRLKHGRLPQPFVCLRKTGRHGAALLRVCSGHITPRSRVARLHHFCKSCVFPGT